MARAEYCAWVLILQCSAYVNLLDLGLQTATGKFVAEYNALDDRLASGRNRNLGGSLCESRNAHRGQHEIYAFGNLDVTLRFCDRGSSAPSIVHYPLCAALLGVETIDYPSANLSLGRCVDCGHLRHCLVCRADGSRKRQAEARTYDLVLYRKSRSDAV
jgi:hypothetical protein